MKEIKVNDYVQHRVFGYGKIVSVDVPVVGGHGNKVLVKWDQPGDDF